MQKIIDKAARLMPGKRNTYNTEGGPRRGEKTEMQKGISSLKKEVVITILEKG